MHDNEGLIALSGAAEGDVGRAIINGHPETAITLLGDGPRLFQVGTTLSCSVSAGLMTIYT